MIPKSFIHGVHILSGIALFMYFVAVVDVLVPAAKGMEKVKTTFCMVHHVRGRYGSVKPPTYFIFTENSRFVATGDVYEVLRQDDTVALWKSRIFRVVRSFEYKNKNTGTEIKALPKNSIYDRNSLIVMILGTVISIGSFFVPIDITTRIPMAFFGWLICGMLTVLYFYPSMI